MKKTRTRKKPVDPPVASIGDIAFLLIIFFMLTSNFVKETAIKLEPPKSEVIEQLEEIQISVAIDHEGEVHINGSRTTADALESQLTEELANKTTPRGRTVMLKCDREIEKHVFEPVIEAIAAAGGQIAAVGEEGIEE
ncbi:MAG: ExbD/TolR family protein [Verrucomicrobiota bacterium]